jgi:SMP-30/Gluconolactonase/LRE-like region
MEIGAMTENACMPSRYYRLNHFVEGVWSPEDLVDLPGTSWIVVSGMRSARHPGRLFVADARHRTRANELRWKIGAEPARMGPDVFDPHGIAARRLDDGSFELLVVDHGGGEAIDRLRIEFRSAGPVIVGGDRVVQPPNTSANAVAYLPDGGFVMTSMFDPNDRETLSKFARAENTGQVWRWSPDKGWCRFGPLQLSGANGIAASPDGSLVIVCEWAARRVWRLAGDGTPVKNLQTDFLPDNLRWTKDGRLLLAGQIGRPEVVFGCEARGEACPLAFKAVLLDPMSLQMQTLIVVGESQALEAGFGGATGALEVGESIWVGSFTGERIAILSR